MNAAAADFLAAVVWLQQSDRQRHYRRRKGLKGYAPPSPRDRIVTDSIPRSDLMLTDA